jgi:hypothetical protein
VRTLRGEVVLLALFLVLTPVLLTPWIHGTDGVGYYVYVRSSVIDRDLNFTNEYAHYVKLFPYVTYSHDPNTGLIVNQYLVGTAIAWAPFFLIGHMLAAPLGYSADGYSAPYVVAVSFGSSVYAFLAVLFAYKFSKRYFTPKDSILSAIGIWFASSLPYYMWLDPSLSHSVSAFLVSAFLYVTCAWNPKRGYVRWALAGALLGLMGITRPADLAFAVIPIFTLSKFKKQTLENGWRSFTLSNSHLAFPATIFLALLPQFVVWKVLRGTFFPSVAALVSISGSWTAQAIVLTPRVFLSPLHGLFYWTPITAFGVAGALLMVRERNTRSLGAGILVAILIEAVLVNGWSFWYAPASFGERFFVNATAPLVLGLAGFVKEARTRIRSNWATYGLLSLLILWNAGLLIQYGIGLIGPNDPESYPSVAYNDFFIVLPELLFILTTFLTTRMGHAQL